MPTKTAARSRNHFRLRPSAQGKKYADPIPSVIPDNSWKTKSHGNLKPRKLHEMRINNSNYSISEILQMLERKDLNINREYQRGSGLWPAGARSYFIDTILEEYPFPKIYMYEFIDRPVGKMRKELVDGQQRILTIKDFVEGKFTLAGDTRFASMKYSDLDEEMCEKFLAYTVSVDVIRNATRSQILQMFRRMNAYTLPLNEAEKRHSSFYGEFKWFINSLTSDISDFIVNFGVFTNKQIVRMADSELMADCVLASKRGIISTSPSDLRALYREYDEIFPDAELYRNNILSAINFIVTNLENLRGTYMMKPYALHSLITTLIHARYRVEAIGLQIEMQHAETFCAGVESAATNLMALADAHETKEIDGPHRQYVWGCLGGTNRAGRRLARTIAILHALGFKDARVINADLARLLPE